MLPDDARRLKTAASLFPSRGRICTLRVSCEADMRRRDAVLALCAVLAVSTAASVRNGAHHHAAPAQAGPNIAKPVIVTREAWKAKTAGTGMEPQTVTGIILHQTGIRKNAAASLGDKMRALQSFSQHPGEVAPGRRKPAWPDVPYHFYVDAGGRIAEGREIRFAGDTSTNYNPSGFIQVVVEGDFDKEIPSPEQLSAVRDLVTWLIVSNGLSPDDVTTHADHARTDCPGRNFRTALPGVLSQIHERLARVSVPRTEKVQ